jgi:hypothetical protein
MLRKSSYVLGLLLSICLSSNATHYVGGEIYWKCIPNTGKYVFYLDFYRDCGPGTANISTSPTSIQVLNTPRPNNNTLSSIPMQFVPPEPGSPLGPNGGLSVAPECIGCGTSSSSNSISCTNQDQGTLEKYTYRSAPITLSGKPPSGNANQNLNGWVFAWTAPCCRSGNVINITNRSSSALFKAIMYGDGRPTQDPCYDSSPLFSQEPTSIVCQKYDFQYNNGAFDVEKDSLSFKWAAVVNSSMSPMQYQPQLNSWAAGFSTNNPTPTSAMNPANKSARIDPKTGNVNMFVVLPPNVPANQSRVYITSTQVDAWGLDANGNRVKKATIFRDMPFNIFDCPRNTFTYNDNNGNPISVDQSNQPPLMQIDGVTGTLSLDTTIYAGDSIAISFLAADTNAARCSPSLLSTVSIEPYGQQFDTGFTNSMGNCLVRPCATLLPAPTGSRIKKLSGLNTVGTKFMWQTTCDHLSAGSTFNSGGSVTYNFVFKTYDDFCPVPGVQYASINITVKAPKPLGPPVIKCLTENSDGTYTLRWSGPQLSDTTNSFESYELFLGQRAIGSSAPFAYLATPIRVNLTDYNGSFTTPVYAPGQEYSFRMKTKWGCGGLSESVFSTPISLGTLPSNVQGSISENGSVLQLAINDADTYQWFRNGTAIQGATSNTYQSNNSGNYTVVYTYDSCSYTSNAYAFTFVGLLDQSLNAYSVTVFPNPTNGQLQIQWDEQNVDYQVAIFGLDGKLYYSGVNDRNLNLSAYSSNVYLLKLTTPKGVIFKKVVKK